MADKPSSAFRRILWLAVCCLLLATYLRAGYRVWLAHRSSLTYETASLEKAIQLEPTNAWYRDLLGRHDFVDLQDAAKALPRFQQATALNSYDAAYWMDVANACERLGRPAEQAAALQRALYAEPTTPNIAWDAGNFALLRGDTATALRRFKVVLANDPEMAPQALALSWRASGNAAEIIATALPPRSDSYQQFLQLLIKHDELPAAKQVWTAMLALPQPYRLRDAFPYLDFLLAHQDVAGALEAWQTLALRDPAVRSYQPSAENAVVNGGFERPLLNGGFDWRYTSTPALTIGLDNTTFHGGTTALLVTFDKVYVADAVVSQAVAVKPGAQYAFSAWVRTVDMVGAEGPRLAISDAYTRQVLFTSDDYLGDNNWTEIHTRFRVPPATRLLKISVARRDAEKSAIKGQLWLDDVSLKEMP